MSWDFRQWAGKSIPFRAAAPPAGLAWMIIMGLTEVSHEVTLLRKVDHAILLLPTVHKTQFDPVTFAVVCSALQKTQSSGCFSLFKVIQCHPL